MTRISRFLAAPALFLCDAGQSYTDGEYRRWLQAGGFGNIERNLMRNNMSLITALKL